jgi:hypothetical protein
MVPEPMEVFLRLCAFAALPGSLHAPVEPARPATWAVPDYIPDFILKEFR